jgi:hypothetical protein
MKHFTTADFQRWGAQGGRKSRRVLTTEQAKAMVAAREKKKLNRNHEHHKSIQAHKSLLEK